MKHLFMGLIALSLSFATFGRDAFIENKGQITDQHRTPNSDVLYLYNGHGLNVQLRKNGFSYDIWQKGENGQMHFNRIDIDFANRSAAMTTQCSERSAGIFNYYTEYTGEKGITGVHSYDKVLYKNVWDGIDIEFLLAGEKPKYNFILHPGANLGDIKLDIKGARSITQNGNGLRIATTITTLEETLPHSFYTQASGKTDVTAKLQANGDGTYGISVLQNIPANSTLVIDPVPTVRWGTFYGDTGHDNIEAVTTDTFDHVYVFGSTNSMNAIATAGAHESTAQGSYDAFVAKFTKAGVRIWGSYYGGPDEDRGIGMAVERSGLNLYLTGHTQSWAGIATTGSHQDAPQNMKDAYLAKFDSSGQRVWATYYGEFDDDQGRAVAIDEANNVYLTGDTRSNANISTPGAFQTSNNGMEDCFIAKFTPAGTRIWGTYFGGSDYETFNSIHIVKDRIYLAGQTGSFTNIATPGAFQTTKNGYWDAVLAKFDTAGARMWSTYYGTSSFAYEGDVTAVLDENANIYVTGFTQSQGMATPGAHQTTNAGANDGFIARFDSTGARIWSTYYGGSDNDHPTALTLARGDLFVVGYTFSFGGITTPNAVYPTMVSGGRHVVISRWDTTGKMKWGTYYQKGEAYTVAADKEGVYVAGGTELGQQATPGSHQPVLAGSRDAFLLKLDICDAGFATASANNPILLNGTINLQASGGAQYQWSHANGFSSSLQNPTISNAKITDSGTYTVVVTDTLACTDTVRVSVQITNHVNEVLAKSFRVYPNPSATFVVVENTDGLKGTIALVTTDGKLVYNTPLNGQQQKIDIRTLAAGTYFLNINTGKGTTTLKLLKE